MTDQNNIRCSVVDTGTEQFATVFDTETGETICAGSDHPNWPKIIEKINANLAGDPVTAGELTALFDVEETVRIGFAQLTERISVKNGEVLLDGDPVDGALQEQILDFVEAGEDFAPLVNFYEKLETNPLGDVRKGLYDWIVGQRAEGALTITPEGNVLGYKSTQKSTPEWRKDEDAVYVPSRRGEGIVNGRDVKGSEFIEQVPGDVVEMPRSRVLHAPSQACGDGLHIGTYGYAKTFQGDTVLLVEFNPRDIVSLPDSNASWKLRVCRYTVIEPVDGPLDVPVYQTHEDVDEGGCPDCAEYEDESDDELVL